MKKTDSFTKPELVLGKAYNVFARLNAYIDCFYEASVCWNSCNEKAGLCEIRFRQAGRTLCTLYLKNGYFSVVFVFGADERTIFEGMSKASVSKNLLHLYDTSKTYHDGKWILMDVRGDEAFNDLKLMLGIKRKPNGMTMTMCGLKCGKCRAYVKNAKTPETDGDLAAIWYEHYGVHINPSAFVCDGCRCMKSDARLLDDDCPVRACVLERGLHHCGQCEDFPCVKFDSRENLCFESATPSASDKSAGRADYDSYLATYDNRTRLTGYKKLNLKK